MIFFPKLEATTLAVLASLSCQGALAQCGISTNLPPVSPGVFNASACVEIDAPIETVWNALLDFPAYPDWNPFVRSQTIVNDLLIPSADQSPAVGDLLLIWVQLPPLPEPVSATTPPNPLHAQMTIENVTAVEPDLYRIAWTVISYPSSVLTATRWSAMSSVEASDGSGTVTQFESIEAYNGPLASTVEDIYGTDLQEGFGAQASAFQALLESCKLHRPVNWYIVNSILQTLYPNQPRK